MAPKLIQCIKFSFSLTAEARFRWINNKSVPHSSSIFACGRGKNTCAPSIVYRLLIGWNCHTTWSQGNLHYMRLHFLKLDQEFFCLQPSLAGLYSAAASPSERLRSDGSLAIINVVMAPCVCSYTLRTESPSIFLDKSGRVASSFPTLSLDRRRLCSQGIVLITETRKLYWEILL